MKYNRCGRSGIKLPAISLGLWHNFGELNSYQNSKELLTGSFDLGINHFDLANNYGPPLGAAENTLGKVLKNELKDHRDELFISTKAGHKAWDGPFGDWGSRKHLISSLDQSLSRLGLDYVDLYYHHRPDPDTPIEETMGALNDIVKQGKALYVGISMYRADQAKKAIDELRKLGTPCLIHQPNYSMYDRWVEDDLLDLLVDEGVGCIPFMPLQQGLLTDKYLKGIPADSRAAKDSGFLKKDQVSEEVIKKSLLLKDLAIERGQTLAQMALAWVLRDGKVTSALIGASRISQVEENVKALENLEFSNDELQIINSILK
ncbi:MAG: aldo/keto reductase [Spirochaetaceae bacterium]